MLIATSPQARGGAWSYWGHPLISEEGCDTLAATFTDRWEPVDVEAGPGGPARRRCATQPLDAAMQAELYPLLIERCSQVNADLFGFLLTGIPDWDPPVVVRYGPGDGHDWHYDGDRGGETATRKLSFSLQLSDPDDYEGADLRFMNGPVMTRAKGSLVLFASFVPHCVEPVTRGERLAVVGWVHGPTFH